MRWTNLVRYSFSLLALLFAVFRATAALTQSFPYEAHIAVPGAPIRSGPGDEFYICDTLPEGETVEVYRHRHNGWCAIRPTEGSFSWVFGPHLHLLDDSLAEIDKPEVASRIGSRLGQQRNAVQVRLKKGEVVQVLEEVDERGQKWFKIAPPAGEFRWIHTSCLRRSDGSPGIKTTPVDEPIEARPIAPPERPVVTVAANEEVSASAPTNDWRAAPVAPPLATTPSPFTNTTQLSPAPTTATAPVTAASPSPTSASPTSPPKTAQTTTPITTSATTTASPTITVADGLSRQLTDVELLLSRMVAESPATWQIEPLQKQAQELLTQAQTVTEREAVKVTLEKVDRFAAIQRRHRELGATQSGATAASAAGASPITPVTDSAAGKYDAVGVLRPVVSKRPGAPQFALVDPRGQVVSFVSPTPDVNLQPYVGHRIGIVGNRGFIPEFHRAHVTAGRVTPLDQNLVR